MLVLRAGAVLITPFSLSFSFSIPNPSFGQCMDLMRPVRVVFCGCSVAWCPTSYPVSRASSCLFSFGVVLSFLRPSSLISRHGPPICLGRLAQRYPAVLSTFWTSSASCETRPTTKRPLLVTAQERRGGVVGCRFERERDREKERYRRGSGGRGNERPEADGMQPQEDCPWLPRAGTIFPCDVMRLHDLCDFFLDLETLKKRVRVS